MLARRLSPLASSAATPSSSSPAGDASPPLQPSSSSLSSKSAFIFGLGYTGLGLACLLLEEGW